MKTTHHITTITTAASLFIVHFALFIASAPGARAQAPVAAIADAKKATASSVAYTAGDPIPLPNVVYYDTKAYAWIWNAQTSAWQLVPRNEARVLHEKKERGKQHTGILTIDGHHAVPSLPGENVYLMFRKKTDFQTFKGLPEGESGIEVVKLDITDGPKKNQLIRTAKLRRQGEASATFGDKREPITVQIIRNNEGTFYFVQLLRPLSEGRYALYLPDRAFEFAIK